VAAANHIQLPPAVHTALQKNGDNIPAPATWQAFIFANFPPPQPPRKIAPFHAPDPTTPPGMGNTKTKMADTEIVKAES
jgi:hypothetical protein